MKDSGNMNTGLDIFIAAVVAAGTATALVTLWGAFSSKKKKECESQAEAYLKNNLTLGGVKLSAGSDIAVDAVSRSVTITVKALSIKIGKAHYPISSSIPTCIAPIDDYKFDIHDDSIQYTPAAMGNSFYPVIHVYGKGRKDGTSVPYISLELENSPENAFHSDSVIEVKHPITFGWDY